MHFEHESMMWYHMQLWPSGHFMVIFLSWVSYTRFYYLISSGLRGLRSLMLRKAMEKIMEHRA